MTVSDTAQTSGRRTFFARQATGLVREAGLLDMILFNIVENTTLGVGFAFGVTYILTALVGTNLVVSQIIATIFGLFVVTTWGLLSASIPRSGGDYVLNTRVLSPALSFVGSWGMFMSSLVFNGIVAAWVSQLMLSPAFASLGMVMHNSTLANIGSALGTTGWTFVIGTIALLVTGFVAMLGMRPSMRVQAVMVLIGMLGFVVALLALVFMGHSTFVSNFNAVSKPYTHQADTYHYFLTAATKGGLSITYSHAVQYTFIAFLAIQGLVANSFWSAYVAGEIKGVRGTRRQWFMMLAPVLITGILLTLAFILLFYRLGYNFVTAANYLSAADPTKYAIPAPPYASLLTVLGTGNGLLTFIVGFGLCGWGIAMALANYLFMSRILFAWSFDRIVPLKISEVNDRLHSPIVALGIVFVGSEVVLYIFAFLHSQASSFVASYFLLGTLALALVGVSGIVFPYIRRDMYENSPAKIEVAGIPVISIAGAITLLGEIGTGLIYFFYPTLGLPSFGTTAAILLIPLAVGLAIFLVAKAVRQREGIDLNAVYRSIPPE
ncbi:MAG TPA: amino acid permease [Chloroflexota bacterium]|nr:amino acid permease [Chloroflexota bacterium]